MKPQRSRTRGGEAGTAGLRTALIGRVPVRRAATVLGDLFAFDPRALAWTDLTAQQRGKVPTARYCPGFVAAGSKIYLHSGGDFSGGT